ncbi:MAG: palindromic element RPE4 domain-containing protein [Rickettsia aeschlimannii]
MFLLYRRLTTISSKIISILNCFYDTVVKPRYDICCFLINLIFMMPFWCAPS